MYCYMYLMNYRENIELFFFAFVMNLDFFLIVPGLVFFCLNLIVYALST